MTQFTHEFEAALSNHGVGKSRVIWYQVLFLPARLAKDLPFSVHPKLRVRGEINDFPVAQAKSELTIQRRVQRVLDELMERR